MIEAIEWPKLLSVYSAQAGGDGPGPGLYEFSFHNKNSSSRNLESCHEKSVMVLVWGGLGESPM